MKLKSDYRISRESVADVVKEKLLEAATDGVTKACLGCPASQQKKLFKRLTVGQKAIPLLGLLEGEVYNGGLHQFFWNSSGNNSANILEALLAIQAEHYVSIFQKALAVLAVKGKLENRQQRQSALKLVSRDAFDEFDDTFYKLNDNESSSLEKLCAKYFQEHPEDFFLPAGTPPRAVGIDAKDYRLPKKRAEKLSGKNIHWLPIEKIWEDYWEAIKGDKKHAENFIVGLTPGQRALIAIQILNNLVVMGGFWEVLCFSFWPELLIKEVIAGYALLEAKPYTDLINEVVAAGGEILSQTSQMTAVGNEKSKLKLRGEVETAKDLGRQYMNLYKSRNELGKKFAQSQVEFGDRFKQMMEAPETKIEKYISGYLTKHQIDFFKK